MNIPVIAFEVKDGSSDFSFGNYSKYRFDNDVVMGASGTEAPIICLNIESAETIKTKLGTTSNNVDRMANCGLGLLNLTTYTDRTAFNNTGYAEKTGTVGRAAKEHLACVACKPGFKPDSAKTANSDTIVRGCTQIPHCTGTDQTFFNACSQCDTGYTWEIDDAGKIHYDTCVQVPS